MYKAKSNVLVYTGNGAWRFLSLPPKMGKEIKELYGKYATAYGSIRVMATVGKTNWKTSIFPDKKSGTYLLPLKAEVRKAEAISDTDAVRFIIQII